MCLIGVLRHRLLRATFPTVVQVGLTKEAQHSSWINLLTRPNCHFHPPSNNPHPCSNCLSQFPMNRRTRPIHRALHITMLDWIDVNIVHMLREIVIIPDLVFPVPALPYATLALARSAAPYHLGFRDGA